MDTDLIEARVARGAALFDAKRPGWDDRIDLDRLDMLDTRTCVVGQEFAGQPEVRDGWGDPYDLGTDVLFPHFVGNTSAIDGAAIEHGFDRQARVYDYAELTAAWKRLILARRAGAR